MAKNADICNRMEWAVKVMILRQNRKKNCVDECTMLWGETFIYRNWDGTD